MYGQFDDSLKQIAHFAGQYYINLNNPLQMISSNFESCIMGAMTSSYWINFNDYYLKMTVDMLAKLTQAYQMKK